MTELPREIVNLIYRASCCKDTPEEAANEPCACAAAYIVEQIESWANEKELATTKQESEKNMTEKIKPVWQWPKWLKGEFLVESSVGAVQLCEHEPKMVDGYWSTSPLGWIARVDHIIDLEWPKFDRWQDSLIAKSDCETVE